MIAEVKPTEKIIKVVNACLNSYTHTLTDDEIMIMLFCCKKTAHRLMVLIYDMRFEIPAFNIELFRGDYMNRCKTWKIEITLAFRI